LTQRFSGSNRPPQGAANWKTLTCDSCSLYICRSSDRREFVCILLFPVDSIIPLYASNVLFMHVSRLLSKPYINHTSQLQGDTDTHS
jgi:hypothetical protein